MLHTKKLGHRTFAVLNLCRIVLIVMWIDSDEKRKKEMKKKKKKRKRKHVPLPRTNCQWELVGQPLALGAASKLYSDQMRDFSPFVVADV